jgi:hypothetical protein
MFMDNKIGEVLEIKPMDSYMKNMIAQWSLLKL